MRIFIALFIILLCSCSNNVLNGYSNSSHQNNSFISTKSQKELAVFILSKLDQQLFKNISTEYIDSEIHIIVYHQFNHQSKFILKTTFKLKEGNDVTFVDVITEKLLYKPDTETRKT